MCTLGSSPKESAQPQNIFVRVAQLDVDLEPDHRLAAQRILAPSGRASKPIVRLERERRLQQALLGEGGRRDLQANRQPRPAAAGSASPAGIEIAGMPASGIGTVK